MKTETAILAGGCFWGMQDLIRKLPGVVSTRVGYSGGDVPHATYRNHGTHAEAIEIVFDPQRLSYRELLEFFFAFHDPTTLNRQGPDEGTQYRSAISYHTTEQKSEAEKVIAELEKNRTFSSPIVTELSPAREFYPAEAYHVDYYRRNPDKAYCRATIGPKVSKLRSKYAARLK